MMRIVDGLVFFGEEVRDRWVVRSWEQNGVLERSATPYVRWTEFDGGVDELTDEKRSWLQWLLKCERTEPTDEELEERRQKSLESAARRAKTTCRRVIITEGFNELLTLTYKGNQGDWDLCKQHFKLWVKRMKRALGNGFRYCAAFERQDRGAMHVHIATHKLPKMATYKGAKVKAWEVGTRIWRDVVGELGGLCFVGGKSRYGGPSKRKWTLAAMAAYVSKYITKSYSEAAPESNRYSRSNGTVIAKPEAIVVDCTFAELIGLVYEYRAGDKIVSLRPGRFKDRLWFCRELNTAPGIP